MKYTKQYPGYKPDGFFYGFIGKDFPVKSHFFSGKKDFEANRKHLSEEIGIPEA